MTFHIILDATKGLPKPSLSSYLRASQKTQVFKIESLFKANQSILGFDYDSF